MPEPKVEYKNRRDTPISLVETKINRAEAKAQQALVRLELALVRCGYTRPCRYCDRPGGPGRPATVLIWDNGKIQMAQGKGKPLLGVKELGTSQLLRVADHLPAFVDEMERNSRWVLKQMLDALDKLEKFVEQIEADPQPSE